MTMTTKPKRQAAPLKEESDSKKNFEYTVLWIRAVIREGRDCYVGMDSDNAGDGG